MEEARKGCSVQEVLLDYMTVVAGVVQLLVSVATAIKSDKKLTLEILRNKDVDNKEMIKHHFVHKEGFVFGSCQVSLFDENFLIRQGGRELRLWPFEMFNPRMVCQGECFNKDEDEIGTTKKTNNFKPERINQTMSLQIEFQSFAGKVGWRL